MKVREVMESQVITATPQMSVGEAARLLYDNDLSALPVVEEDGNLTGIISEQDLIYRLAKLHLPPHIELLGGVIYLENPFEMKKELEKMTAVTIEKIMTRTVATVSPEADVEDAATLMVDMNINGVPVIEEGKIIGIVTRHDLLTALARKEIGDTVQVDTEEEAGDKEDTQEEEKKESDE